MTADGSAPRRLAGSFAAATVVLTLALLAAPTASPADSSGTVIHTDKGWVIGSASTTMRTFFGIPFAKPTSGALRFHAPVPPAPWLVRLATGHSPACAQEILSTNEDCLGLDVYAPPVAVSHSLPVMVWIYGGGYLLGSNSMYNPAPIVDTGKAIVVELNYRLGPFGFLALPGLDGESPAHTSGDYALMDQQAGLRWVQRNIAAFGGDPRNVTVFGESAGGNSVCAQLASPLATGLFERAISESGSCAGEGLQPVSEATMVQRSEAFAARVGCPDPATMVACLRALPASKLLSDPSTNLDTLAATWVPDVDGYVETHTLQDAWSGGAYDHVPMLVGTNLNEGRLFVFLFDELPHLSALTPAEYTAYAQQTFGSNASSVLAQYPISAYGATDLAKGQLVTDGYFACPAEYVADHASATGGHVWRYEFADPNPPFSNLDPFMALGDMHFSEVPYLFNLATLTPAQSALSAQMVSAWTNFASTGQPGAIGDTAWPQWSSSAPETMVLTSVGSHLMTNFAAEHQCGFWGGITGG